MGLPNFWKILIDETDDETAIIFEEGSDALSITSLSLRVHLVIPRYSKNMEPLKFADGILLNK